MEGPWVLGGTAGTGACLEFVPPLSLGPWTASPMLFAIPHPATCRATSQSHFPSLTTPPHTLTGRTSCPWPRGAG